MTEEEPAEPRKSMPLTDAFLDARKRSGHGKPGLGMDLPSALKSLGPLLDENRAAQKRWLPEIPDLPAPKPIVNPTPGLLRDMLEQQNDALELQRKVLEIQAAELERAQARDAADSSHQAGEKRRSVANLVVAIVAALAAIAAVIATFAVAQR